MCALLLFAVLAVCSSLHAQSTGIYVNSSNNVGIGTTTPVEKLNLCSTAAAGYAKIGFSNDSTNFGVMGFGGNYLGQPTQTNDMVFRSDAGNILFGFNGGEKMRIATTGNVGIGTTNPARKLDVNGDVNVGTNLVVNSGLYYGTAYSLGSGFNFKNATAGNLLTIQEGGNVGIGTTSPTSFGGGSVLTEIHGTTTYGALLASTNNVIGELFASEGGEVYVGSRTNHLLRVVVNNSPRITIDTSGNVGIGTTGPQYLLDVAGQVHASSFVASSGNNYADFVFKPGYKLEPLSAVEASIQKDGHLPGIPSEAEAKEHGIDLASMQVKLLQKIEELTLHQIEQQKLLENQTERLDDQSKRIEQLEQENTELRAQL